jgi:hypothetical protein
MTCKFKIIEQADYLPTAQCQAASRSAAGSAMIRRSSIAHASSTARFLAILAEVARL